MARISRPDSVFRVSIHKNGGHSYAATHPFTVDQNGNRKYSVVHWGTVTEDLRFIPGKRYLQAPAEVREKLIFPDGWDLSAIEGSAPAGGSALPFYDGDENKSFGDIWLLEQIVGKFALREDLAEAFGPSADDLLTLAYFPFLTGMSFQRFARWQASTKVPSNKPLDAMVSGSLAAVSRSSFKRFMELRRARYASDNLCAVDSVLKHSFGSLVSDRRWGQKTERIHFNSTVEAVAYSLDSHIPVVCSSYPDAVSDARGIGIFRSELEKAGLKGITVVTDRGYDSLRGLEPFYEQGPMVMCVDVKQPAVMERIEAFGRFRSHPAGMRYDAASRRWYRQYSLDSQGLRLNLFFNPERRAAELAQIDLGISSQLDALKEITEYGVTISDRKKLRHDFFFFKTVYDSKTQKVVSYTPDKNRIVQSRAASGFYANITSDLDIGPLEAVSIYSLKYDQEKFLRQFLSLMDFPQVPPVTQNLNYGLQVLQYIGLLLNTFLRHAFRPVSPVASAPGTPASQGFPRLGSQTSSSLDGTPGTQPAFPYRTFTEILDDFQSVPCTDAGNGTCRPGPLTETQQHALSLLGL